MKKLLSTLLVSTVLLTGVAAHAALPYTFANLSGNVPAGDLDANFNAVNAMGITQCTASGTNTIALAPNANQGTVSGYANYQEFSFVAINNSTGAVSININSLGALPLYLAGGTTQANSGNIAAGGFYQIAYNSALNSGLGGFVILNPTLPSTSGTVTSVATGTGLTGGPITSSGTIALATGTANTLAGYNGSGVFSGVTVGSGLSLSGGTISSTSGGGSVTSVTFTGDGVVDSSTPSSAVTSSGTVTATVKSQTAHTVLAGPTSGSAAAPTFRTLAGADLPAATTSTLGAVSTDGSTITNTSGAISCTTGTTSQLGCLEPDGTTITVSGGVISAASGLPTAVTGTLSGSSTVFTVDFTTYSAYRMYIFGIVQNGVPVEATFSVSTNGGSSYVTASARDSKLLASSTVTSGNSFDLLGANNSAANAVIDIFEPTTSSNTMINSTSVETGGTASDGTSIAASTYSTSAAINRIKISESGSPFTGGNVVLQPISKR